MTKTLNKIKYFFLVALFAIASVFAIGCGEDKINGISVDSESYKNNVYQYQDYDLSTIKLIVDMKKGNDKVVGYAEVSIFDGDEQIQELDTSVPGEKELKVKYEGFETTIKINIIELELTEIEVDTTNCNLNVYQGGIIDFSNLVVKAKFNDLSEKTIAISDADLDITYSTAEVGEKDCVVAYTYNGTTKSASFKINVREINVESISIDQDALESFKFYQYQGVAGLDFSAIKLNIVNNDSSTDEVAFNDVNVDYEFDLTTAGDKSLVITYFEKTTTLPYSVIGLDAIDFKYNESDSAIEIWEDENLDETKIAVKAIYADEHEINLSKGVNGYSISTIDKTNFTEQDWIVTYNGNTDSIKVTVKDIVLLSISIEEYPEEIYSDETLNSSNVRVFASYSNDTEVEIAYAEVDFSELNMNLYDTQTLTATYEGKTDSVQIIVKEREESRTQEKNYQIKTFKDPAFVNVFKSITTGEERKKDEITSQADLLDNANPKKRGFASLSEEGSAPLYVIGEDNPFEYKPVMQYLDKSTMEMETIEKYKSLTKIYIWRDSAYVQLDRYSLVDENKISYYVDIDDENNTYDFTENAIDHQFKIVVEPYLYDPDVDADIDGGSVFEFIVKDGWNADSVEDLKLFDNIDIIEDKANQGEDKIYIKGKWNKTAEEMELSNSIDGLILHNDINVTFDDLPAYFKEGANVRDENGIDGWIFAREIGEGEVFNFEGNYFKISASSLPVILHEDGKSIPDSSDIPVVTHLVLFGFRGKTENAQGQIIEYTDVPEYNINNVEFVGNSQESGSAENWGGISTFKAGGADVNINNCLFNRWYMAMMYETEKEFDDVNDLHFRVIDTNAYDVSNTIVYLWGAEDAYFENSKFIGSAGPVIITDHVYTDAEMDKSGGPIPSEDGYKTNLVVKDCKFESWLYGTEPWFATFETEDENGSGMLADLVAQIKALDYFYMGTGQTILKDGYLNVVGLYKCGNIQGMSYIPIEGTFTDISTNDQAERIYPEGLDFTQFSSEATIEAQCRAMYDNYKAPVLKTSGGSVGVPSETGWLVPPTNTTVNEGDYLFIHHGGSGMAFILQFIPRV